MSNRGRTRKGTARHSRGTSGEGRATGGALPFVQAAARIKPAVAQGHPWIYREAIERAPSDLENGSWVHVQCGNLQVYGVWDAQGPIAVRLLNTQRPPNRAFVQARVEEAWQRREVVRRAGSAQGQPTTAWRWIYGESDGLPGIVVDLYGHLDTAREFDPAAVRYWAVLRVYSASVVGLVPWVVDALERVAQQAGIQLAGIVERPNWDDGDGPRALVVHRGEEPPGALLVREYGVRFEADLVHGQKTGFFLDQRENRRTIGQWSAGRRVLNLFAYTGGFSVFAALGGAARITSVDIAGPAMAAAARNFVHNGLDPEQHEFITADCFDLLEKYHGEGRRFDLIVVDPPSFARSRSQQAQALHAYTRLNTLAMKCLEPGGILASSSCTSQVSPDAFREMLAVAATDAKRRALILHEAGQAPDHPVPVGFPEARYLKFVLAAVAP